MKGAQFLLCNQDAGGELCQAEKEFNYDDLIITNQAYGHQGLMTALEDAYQNGDDDLEWFLIARSDVLLEWSIMKEEVDEIKARSGGKKVELIKIMDHETKDFIASIWSKKAVEVAYKVMFVPNESKVESCLCSNLQIDSDDDLFKLVENEFEFDSDTIITNRDFDDGNHSVWYIGPVPDADGFCMETVMIDDYYKEWIPFFINLWSMEGGPQGNANDTNLKLNRMKESGSIKESRDNNEDQRDVQTVAELIQSTDPTRRSTPTESEFKFVNMWFNRHRLTTPREPYKLLLQPEGPITGPHGTFLITSIIKETRRRNIIRRHLDWTGLKGSYAFVFGRGENEIENKILQTEHEEYDDIISADFIDAYHHIIEKTTVMLEYYVNHIHHNEFAENDVNKRPRLIKMDDDIMFRDLKQLFPNDSAIIDVEKGIVSSPRPSSVACNDDFKGVTCHVEMCISDSRKTRIWMYHTGHPYFINRRSWPFAVYYPAYCVGPMYSMDGESAVKILTELHLTYFAASPWNSTIGSITTEDNYIPGILRTLGNIKIRESPDPIHHLAS